MSDKIEVERVQKRGDWYVVEGIVNGHRTSVDLTSPSVERQPEKDAREYMKRSLKTVAEHEGAGR